MHQYQCPYRLAQLERTPLARRYFRWLSREGHGPHPPVGGQGQTLAGKILPVSLPARKPVELINRACWPNSDNVFGYHVARAALRRGEKVTLVNTPMMVCRSHATVGIQHTY